MRQKEKVLVVGTPGISKLLQAFKYYFLGYRRAEASDSTYFLVCMYIHSL
jgi:hypothetical protein